MSGDPLLDTVLEMTSAAVDRVDFSDEVLQMVRLAALVAVDASPASYLVDLGAGPGTTLTVNDARSVLIAVAPIVGTPRVVTASGRIAEALGLAIDLDELGVDQGGA